MSVKGENLSDYLDSDLGQPPTLGWEPRVDDFWKMSGIFKIKILKAFPLDAEQGKFSFLLCLAFLKRLKPKCGKRLL